MEVAHSTADRWCRILCKASNFEWSFKRITFQMYFLRWSHSVVYPTGIGCKGLAYFFFSHIHAIAWYQQLCGGGIHIHLYWLKFLWLSSVPLVNFRDSGTATGFSPSISVFLILPVSFHHCSILWFFCHQCYITLALNSIIKWLTHTHNH